MTAIRQRGPWLAVLFVLALPAPVTARPGPGQPLLPAWETDAEKARTAAPHKNATFRSAHPELYGRTDPPVTPVSFYAEFAPVSHVYYTWWPGQHDDFFAGITAAVTQYGDATVAFVVEDVDHQADLAAELASRSLDTTNVIYVDISGYPYYASPWNPGRLDSYWMVDYGPFWVLDGNDTLAIVDPRYYPDRTNDDGLPAKLADLYGLSTFRPDLNLEGGNLMSDGAGTCILTSKHLLRNAELWPYQVDEILEDDFGCEQVIWLEPLANERTGHVDMFAKWLTPSIVIVGEYTPQQDPENAAILDENALRLANASNLQNQPLQVVRIPMPDQGNAWFGTVWRTYTNSILVNDLVVVPTYAEETSREASALAVYESVLPGATIVGVDADSIIPEGGAIHCVTRTRPTATATALESPPAEACGGAWDCPPTGCGELDEAGICLVEIAAWCAGGQIESEHCLGDEVCGWDLQNLQVGCVPPGCGPLTATGACQGVGSATIATWCDADGYPRAQRCRPSEFCGADDGLGRVTCLDDPPPCTDECVPGATGCTADATATWGCGEAGDGDDCLERLVAPCDPGWTCEIDRCVPACQDECAAGETGCASDFLGEWSCGEADDGDVCLDRLHVDCAPGEVCREQGCEPEQRPLSPGGCGCDTGGPADAPLPLCLLFVALGLARCRHR